MRLFNSSTLGEGCGVSWVISSGCEFGVRFIRFSSAFAFIDSFIDSLILLLILTANSCINSLTFLSSFKTLGISSLLIFLIQNPR